MLIHGSLGVESPRAEKVGGDTCRFFHFIVHEMMIGIFGPTSEC